MTAVVVILAATTGAFVIDNYASKVTDTPPLIDCRVSYEDSAVTVTHFGGESSSTTQLEVILRTESGQSRLPFTADTGDGDEQFEAGESASFGSVRTDTEVLVVTENAIVCEGTVSPPPITTTPPPEETDDDEGGDEDEEDEESEEDNDEEEEKDEDEEDED